MSENKISKQIEAAANAAIKLNANHLYMVACGGSYALMIPPKYMMDVECSTLPTDIYNSAEFIQRDPKRLNASSIVIVSSMSGNTPETIDAARFAKEKGALTIGFTVNPDLPLGQTVDYCIEYELTPLKGTKIGAANLLLKLLFSILKGIDNNPLLDDVSAGLDKLPEIIQNTQDAHKDKIAEFAEKYKRAETIYTMGSGANFGPAYSFAICILMEMQWINSNAIHAGEYFHGPFEITDYDVPIIALVGLDKTRPQEERAIAFAQKFTNELIVLDATEFDLRGIPEASKPYVSNIVFGYLLRAYADKLAESRGHPLTVRRYMWKMDY